MAMVAMGVGDDHAVEAADLGREQLLAKVGPAIDEHALAGAFDQDRRAQAVIARLSGIAWPQSLPIFGTPVDVPQPGSGPSRVRLA